MKKLENVVLITGAGQRVGLHLVREFLKLKKYPIVMTYRKSRREIEWLRSQGVCSYQVDFTDERALTNWLSVMQERIGSIRAIIHNASIWVTDSEVGERPELAQQLWQVHVKAPYLINQTLAPLLQAGKGAADIISLSDAHCQKPKGEYIAYQATKAALQQQCKEFAVKLAPTVKVNDIAPGLLMFHPQDTQEYRKARLAKQLIPIEPGAEVIWQTVQYIMNCPYLTGVSIPVDGGVRLT